jgi:hypothetical protein
MHVLNALNIIYHPAEDRPLHDLFVATRTLSDEIMSYTNAPRESRIITREEAEQGLMAALKQVDHSDAFKGSLSKAFNAATERLLIDMTFPVVIKHWDQASKHTRMTACTAFNIVVTQNFREHLGIPVSNFEVFPVRKAFEAETNGSMSTQEYHAVRPFFPGGRHHNHFNVNTEKNSGYNNPYATLHSLTVANLHILMETMAQNGYQALVPKEYKSDMNVWQEAKKDKAFVPSYLEEAFSAQFFRRTWQAVSMKMLNDLYTGIAEADLPEPPKQNLFAKMIGRKPL